MNQPSYNANPNNSKEAIMFNYHPELVRLIANERYERLRREADASRLRREVRQARRQHQT